MKFYQRISLITYLTVIILMVTMIEDTTLISLGERIALMIGLIVLFNMFIWPTKDD